MADHPLPGPNTLAPVPTVSVRTSPNIAVIKYWGKCNEDDVIPLNDSVSVTLQSEQLQTTTSIYVTEDSGSIDVSSLEDTLYVNGEKSALNRRTIALLEVLRHRGTLDASLKKRALLIRSTNNFPTASGMASSASGFAALAHALCHYFKVEGDWSVYARMGSGSACRSMLGGFVHWRRGSSCEDSRAVQLFDEHHWPQLRVLVLVFSSKQKALSSTTAMRRSVHSSALLKQRVRSVEEEKLVEKLRVAIAEKNFESFGRVCMKESNQLHAVCMDTFPPVLYLTDDSRLLIHAIHELNDKCGRTMAAYTFDAGPNAFIFYQEADRQQLLSWLQHAFPTCHLLSDQNEVDSSSAVLPSKTISSGDDNRMIPHIECRVGPGPTILSDSIG